MHRYTIDYEDEDFEDWHDSEDEFDIDDRDEHWTDHDEREEYQRQLDDAAFSTVFDRP
jgi:hypothetical protein